jgi:hypothetical protein
MKVIHAKPTGKSIVILDAAYVGEALDALFGNDGS